MERNWFSSYPPGVPETIDADAYSSLIEAFDKYSEEYAELPAFSNFGCTLTFTNLAQLSKDLAAYLQHHLKLMKGERIAIMLPNLLQFPVAVFAALRVGLAIVNINPLYTAPEIKFQLNDSGATSIIVLDKFADELAKALPDTNVKNVIVTQIGDLLGWKKPIINFVVKYVKKMVPDFNIPNVIAFDKALAQGKRLTFNPVSLSGSDIAFLQYTGGTTGVAKGAVLSHRNMIANVQQCAAWVKSTVKPGEDIVLAALPLYHIFSLTICCLCFIVLGAECLLVTNPRDLDGFMKILRKSPVSIFIGINTLFNAMLHHPKMNRVNLEKIKLTVSGGMATQRAVAEQWQKVTGVPIVEGYGLTEASPVVSINPINSHCFNESVGLPVPATDVIVRDDEGNNLPIGKSGELWVKGPQVMQGYWQNPEETAKVLDKDGWLCTGDIVRMDERGFIYIVDRKKDMISVSGFNVYPNEIEDVIAKHKGVQEVAVIGVPSERTGEAIKAIIVKKDPDLSEEKIKLFCHQSLTDYKIPKFVEFRDELPKTNVGKVLRRELREPTDSSL